MDHRLYSDEPIEFLCFVENVLSHKLQFNLTDKFVDFLLFATYPKLLCTLQYNLWNMDELGKFQLEECFPQNLASEFLVLRLSDSSELFGYSGTITNRCCVLVLLHFCGICVTP